jgi:selenocysteine lyase/cysteine desulfurase
MDWEQIRALFPAVENHVYLNTASGGAMSRYAVEEANRYYSEIHALADIPWDDWIARAEEVRGRAARFINASPDEIAFIPNASLGLNHAARLLVGAGDVLAPEDDFPSVTLPWLQLGVPVHFIPSDQRGAVSVDRITAMLRPGTKVLTTSFVQFQSGFRQDLQALGALCRAHGLVFIVDATQGLGAAAVDVQRDNIDVLVCSGYKWLTAGYGIGLLYIRKDVLQGRPLPAVGWRSARNPYELHNDRLDLASNAVALELGHPPFPGIFTLGGALRVFEAAGMERIEERVHALNDHLYRRLEGIGFSGFVRRERMERAGITMLDTPAPREITAALKQQDILVAARGGRIRVALHFYNDTGDIDRFVAALAPMLKG